MQNFQSLEALTLHLNSDGLWAESVDSEFVASERDADTIALPRLSLSVKVSSLNKQITHCMVELNNSSHFYDKIILQYGIWGEQDLNSRSLVIWLILGCFI